MHEEDRAANGIGSTVIEAVVEGRGGTSRKEGERSLASRKANNVNVYH